jgi:hypothetical protein
MSRTNNTVNYDITAKDAGASSTFARISKEMEKSAAKSQLFGEKAGFFGNELNKFAKIGGIIVAARTLNQMADKTKEWSEQLAKGETTLGKISLELARQIPLFGQIIQAGEKLSFALDEVISPGAAARRARASAQQSARDLSGDLGVGIGESVAGSAASAAAIREIIRRQSVKSLGSDAGRASLAATERAEANQATLKAFDDRLDKLRTDAAKARAALVDYTSDYERIYALDRETREATLKIENDRLAVSRAQLKAETDLVAAQGQQRAALIAGGISALGAGLFEGFKQRAADAAALQSQFAREDRFGELGAEADSIRERMRRAALTPNGRTASAFSDTGASALLSANQSRADDPAVKELRVQTTKLKSIDDEIKKMRQDDKQRSRTEQTQEIFN